MTNGREKLLSALALSRATWELDSLEAASGVLPQISWRGKGKAELGGRARLVMCQDYVL